MTQQWKTIDSAPQDGTPVLLFARLDSAEASTRVVGAYHASLGWFAQSYSHQKIAQVVPSHWMELPPFPGTPPASAQDDAMELKRKTDLIGELSKIIHNMTVAQQAAWIEWQHGSGAEAAMQWIENGLAGPGLVPDADEPYGTEAQAYFDANQADPLPACHCGRPSNILHMGKGYCCIEHYRAALSASQQREG